jgi:hypothetical protein
MSKFETPYHDVVHGVPPELDEHLDEIKQGLSDFIEELGPQAIAAKEIELEKSEKDREIINFVDHSLNEYILKYGRKKIVEIPLDHIQFVPVGGVEKITAGRVASGAAGSLDARLVLDRDPSDVNTALTLFHEFVHLKSFHALKINLGESVKDYRSGVSALSKKGNKVYLKDIEEAVVGLLTKRFYEEKIKGNPLFANELPERQEPYDTSRLNEVAALETLIDELWEKNQGNFASKAELEDIFIRAQVNGHLLKLAHLIEHSRGPKSFRNLADATAEGISSDESEV